MDTVKFYDPRNGAYAGLSNLHPRPVVLDAVSYATAEHAYQVMKARHPAHKAWLAAAPTPELAAVAGDALLPEEIADGWDHIHVAVMAGIIEAKFDQHDDLRQLLLSTGQARIVEWAPDDSAVARFWGEYQGAGLNTLGRLLMQLRDTYRARAAPAEAGASRATSDQTEPSDRIRLLDLQ